MGRQDPVGRVAPPNWGSDISKSEQWLLKGCTDRQHRGTDHGSARTGAEAVICNTAGNKSCDRCQPALPLTLLNVRDRGQHSSLWPTTKTLRWKSIIQVQQPQVKNIAAFFTLTSAEPQSFVCYPHGLNSLIQLAWRIETLKKRCWDHCPW